MKPITTLLLIFFCNITLVAQNKLEYNLKRGNVFLIKQNAKQIIAQELDGATHEITNTIDGVLEFKVTEELENSYQISLTFKDLNLLMTSSIQGELINVKAKEVSERDIQSQIFNGMLNNPVEMTLSKSGDIVSVTGGDSLITKMVNASGLEDEFSKNMIKKSLEKDFGSQALSDNYKQMTFVYSNNEVVIGDTWKNEYTGKLSAKNTWTLKEVNSTSAIITGFANVIMNVEEQTTKMQLTGSQETKIITDLTSGFITSMVVEGFSEGMSTMAQLGDVQIPTNIKSIITYELIN